jgi:hypothetical protein
MTYPRFFWIGETTEIFVAESFEQLVADKGHCGSGLERFSLTDGAPIDDWGDPIEWGEFGGGKRLTIRDTDENDRPCGTFRGSLHDIYVRLNGERFGLPSQLLSSYS